MGLDYSFEMWVPRERLFETFSAIARAEGTGIFDPLIWPDGRRLPSYGKSFSREERDLIPVDGSFEDSPGLSLRFAEDEELRAYDEEELETRTKQEPEVILVPQDARYYNIGYIYVSLALGNPHSDWLEGEPRLVRISFAAATTPMSLLFARSNSVQRFFRELAREVEAVSCDLDKQQDGGMLLYLDGEPMQREIEWGRQHPRWLRHITGAPLTATQSQLSFCRRLSSDATAHERMELNLLLKSEDSGLRLEAMSTFASLEKEEAWPVVEAATHDADWRFRAESAHLLAICGHPRSVQILKRMLDDVHSEVRIESARVLGRLPNTSDTLSRLLFSIPVTTENLGLIKTTFNVLTGSYLPERAARIVKESLEREDFPFRRLAEQKFKHLEKWL